MACCLYFLRVFSSPQWNFKVWKHFFPEISLLLVVGFYQAVLDKCAWKAEHCKEFAIFCIMWSWANTCDEHVEREISKTIVKRRKLCYFPLKNIHTWLWIGWFSYLHRHMHIAVLLFRKKWNSWLFFFCWRPVPAIANVASHRGCCPCSTAQSPKKGAAEN